MDPPFGPDELALLAGIHAAPEDDLPRLVYADWLDENDLPDPAALIRVLCEAHRRPSGQSNGLYEAAHVLQDAVCRLVPSWGGPDPLPGGPPPKFDRGLPVFNLGAVTPDEAWIVRDAHPRQRFSVHLPPLASWVAPFVATRRIEDITFYRLTPTSPEWITRLEAEALVTLPGFRSVRWLFSLDLYIARETAALF